MRLPLVLAANLETLIGVAFVVISLISGLMNYLNSRAKPQGPNRGGRPVRPRSERIQSEIEQFMRDQVKKQEGNSPVAARSEAEQPRPEQRQPTPRPAPQRKPAVVRGPAPRPAPKRPTAPRPPIGQSEQSPATIRPGDDISHRKSITSEGFGQNVRDHLKMAMVERVQSGAESHLARTVSSEVTRHLGVFSGDAVAGPPVLTAPTLAQNLAGDLRSREGMRKGLLMQMILERPAALRRRP